MDVLQAIAQSANGRAISVCHAAGYRVDYVARLNHRPKGQQIILNVTWEESGRIMSDTHDNGPNSLHFTDWQPERPVSVGDVYEGHAGGHVWKITEVDADKVTLVRVNHPEGCRCGGDPWCYTAHWLIGALQGMRPVKVTQ